MNSHRQSFLGAPFLARIAPPGLLLASCLLAPSALGQSVPPPPGSDLERARRAAVAANAETRRAEAIADQADQRVKRAQDALKAAQADLDIAQREQRTAQQRVSTARGMENRAQRELDMAQSRAR